MPYSLSLSLRHSIRQFAVAFQTQTFLEGQHLTYFPCNVGVSDRLLAGKLVAGQKKRQHYTQPIRQVGDVVGFVTVRTNVVGLLPMTQFLSRPWWSS